MTDPRTTPDPEVVSGNDPRTIKEPVADLLRSPAGLRDRQLIFGDPVTVLGRQDGYAYLRSEKDGYLGYVAPSAIGERLTASYQVNQLATHIYSAPSIKSKNVATLSYGASLKALSKVGAFIEIAQGFVPKHQIGHLPDSELTPAQTAMLFLNTPYLWGGNSRLGIDCSGLVQIALLSAGRACPGDSDQQVEAFREHISSDPVPARNDLLYWKGHVALAISETQLIHATAHYMRVVIEPIETVLKRINSLGDAPFLGRVRL